MLPTLRWDSKISKVTAFLITLFCILWTLDLPIYLHVAVLTEQYLALMLGLTFVTLFLSQTKSPVWLKLGAIVALGVLLYATVEYPMLLDLIAQGHWSLLVIGGTTVLFTLEAIRRIAGNFLFGVVSLFLVYALFADKIPGELEGNAVPVLELVQYVGFDPGAVFGTPLKIATTIVIPFIFFGTLLFKAGGGEFFTDLSVALTGKQRGGAAKISIVASTLFGSISGSAVSNVATTGVLTIPLMTKGGYSARDAAAIEAIASTGGQLTPPIMGAAAFLMAEFLEIPFSTVAIAAIIPAALYYIGAFIQVDLIAARDNIRNLDQDVKPFKEVAKEGWHLFIPFAVLFISLFGLGNEAQVAAIVSCLSIVIVGSLREYQGQKIDLGSLFRSFSETGQNVVSLIVIVASAGFVIGVLNITGLGFGLTIFLVQTVGDNLMLLLGLSAVICIILGMGMPTSGVYILLAVLIAPALVEFGIEPIAAHMFILYYGMMSMVTPPIALATFAAATIANTDPIKTGFSAMKIGWIAYVLPFLFVFNTELLLEGEVVDIVFTFVRSIVGMYLISSAVVGYLTYRLNKLARIIFTLMGILCLPLPIVGIASFNFISIVSAVLLIYLCTQTKIKKYTVLSV